MAVGPAGTALSDQGLFEPTGVAVGFEVGSRDGFGPLPDDAELGLVACRWRAPGIVTFDLTCGGGQQPDYPLEVPLSLGIARGDTGIGTGGALTLGNSGVFSITTDLNHVQVSADQPPQTTWDASRSQVPDPARTGCF